MLEYRDATARGRACFASRAIDANTPLLTEAPIASMALPEARRAIRSCEACSRLTGTLTSQLRALAGPATRVPSLPIAAEDERLSDDVHCRRRCGVRYCSERCEASHAAAHFHLCAGRCAPAAAALARFEEHALATHEVFLFGARLVAVLQARREQTAGDDPCAALCRVPWWEISDGDDGRPRSAQEVRDAKRDAAASRRLLLAVIGPDAASWLSLDAWGGLLGAARQNSMCVQLSHPADELLPALREWVARAAEEPSRRPVRALLDALPRPLPPPLSTAVFANISRVNHSCDPNAEVRFLFDDHRATLVATRRIRAGEEVSISYIDDNARAGVKRRREMLAGWGFECECAKCDAESRWQRRLRPRR